MDPYKETQETWDAVAQSYQQKFMDLTIYNESYDQLCKVIPKAQAKLLDIGCGPGNICRYLLKQRPDFEILGIDLSPNMIHLAKKNNPDAKFRVMDARNISQLTNRFDGIVAGFCLPYLNPTDAITFIKDVYLLLNKKGILYLSYVEGDPDNSGYLTGSTGHRTYFSYYNSGKLNSLLTTSGLHISKSIQVPFERSNGESEFHSIIIASKT